MCYIDEMKNYSPSTNNGMMIHLCNEHGSPISVLNNRQAIYHRFKKHRRWIFIGYHLNYDIYETASRTHNNRCDLLERYNLYKLSFGDRRYDH